MSNNTTAYKVKQAINNKGLKQSFIAIKANIDYCRLRRLLNGRGVFTAEELYAVARVLDTDYRVFLSK